MQGHCCNTRNTQQLLGLAQALDQDRVHSGKARDASRSLVLGAFT